MRTSFVMRPLGVMAMALAPLTLPGLNAAEAGAGAGVLVSPGFRETVTGSATFTCPKNEVLLDQAHTPDGRTTYRCGLVFVHGEPAQVESPEWSNPQPGVSLSFEAAPGQVIVGREHSGDRFGTTRYRTATLSRQGTPVPLDGYYWTTREDGVDAAVAGEGEVMVGRRLTDATTGATAYRYAEVVAVPPSDTSPVPQ